MALDAIYLSALTRELAEKITGAKIDKVQQPERDQLLLSLRSRNGNCRLLISAVDHSDIGSLSGHGQRDGSADAPGGSRNESDFIF